MIKACITMITTSSDESHRPGQLFGVDAALGIGPRSGLSGEPAVRMT